MQEFGKKFTLCGHKKRRNPLELRQSLLLFIKEIPFHGQLYQALNNTSDYVKLRGFEICEPSSAVRESFPFDPSRQFEVTPASWGMNAPTASECFEYIKEHAPEKKETKEDHLRRVEYLHALKDQLGQYDNAVLGKLTGIKSSLLDDFEKPDKPMNVNVAYLLSLFFELDVDQAADFLECGKHEFGEDEASIILMLYLKQCYYDISDFVEKVDSVYFMHGLSLPKIFNIKSNPRYKRYTSFSISDCFDEAGVSRIPEVIESVKNQNDLNMVADVGLTGNRN